MKNIKKRFMKRLLCKGGMNILFNKAYFKNDKELQQISSI